MIVNDRGLWASQYQTKPADNVPSLSVNDSNLALAVAEQNMCLLLTSLVDCGQRHSGRSVASIAQHGAARERLSSGVAGSEQSITRLVLFQNWLIEQCKMFEQFHPIALKTVG